ncbi:hypothetical protein [Pengzhenrongella sp.]|jgi:hypothetical protein|uniref:hypothetical protein n=1 Tax=Pengzhenrongella sp. TaxID=2888820 RepID=UPI002F95B55F
MDLSDPPMFPSNDANLLKDHLLVLTNAIVATEIETLAISRFPAAGWDQAAAVERAAAGLKLPRGVDAPMVLRLTRHARLIGPYALGPRDAALLGVPKFSASVFIVEALEERGDPPYPGGDRYGFNRAFPEGTPVRDEERVMHWLVAAARRLGGSIRVGGSGIVLTPDVQAGIDLTVFTDVWLEPETALSVMQRVAPDAHLAMDPTEWAGPPRGIGEPDAPGTTGLSEAARQTLHAEADAFDMAALSAPPELNGYGIQADLEAGGILILEVAGEEVLPVVLASLPWAVNGAIAYRIRWEAPDFLELELEHAPPEHKAARARARGFVNALTREVHRAVGGEVTDDGEFLVNPADL